MLINEVDATPFGNAVGIRAHFAESQLDIWANDVDESGEWESDGRERGGR